jgi:dihydroneopterin aldolase
MDTIFLTGLRTDAVIGIYDWEREIRQVVIVDLEMATDIRRASATDDIQYALNYKSISDRVMQFVTDSSFGLIETLAEQIAELVRSEFQVPWLRVTVHKPDAIPAASDIGVIIERGSRKPVQD